MSVEAEGKHVVGEEDPGKDIEEAYDALEELRPLIRKALRELEARP